MENRKSIGIPKAEFKYRYFHYYKFSWRDGEKRDCVEIGIFKGKPRLIKIMNEDLQRRYDLFCQDAEEFLQYAGYTEKDPKPIITGKALLQVLNTLATLHLPEDKEVNGDGPRGLIWSMYSVFENKSKDQIQGSLALAKVVRYIIKYRPGLQLETDWKRQPVKS